MKLCVVGLLLVGLGSSLRYQDPDSHDTNDLNHQRFTQHEPVTERKTQGIGQTVGDKVRQDQADKNKLNDPKAEDKLPKNENKNEKLPDKDGKHQGSIEGNGKANDGKKLDGKVEKVEALPNQPRKNLSPSGSSAPKPETKPLEPQSKITPPSINQPAKQPINQPTNLPKDIPKDAHVPLPPNQPHPPIIPNTPTPDIMIPPHFIAQPPTPHPVPVPATTQPKPLTSVTDFLNNCNPKGRCWMWCSPSPSNPLLSVKKQFHKQSDGMWCFTSVQNSCHTREDCLKYTKCVDNCQARWGI